MHLLEPTPATVSDSLLRADRVSRLGDKSLGRFKLTPETRHTLATNRIGLFADGFLRLDTMVGRLATLTERGDGMHAMVLYPSKDLGEDIRDNFMEYGVNFADELISGVWSNGAILLSSIESLRELPAECAARVDSLILLDPTCMVYRAKPLRLRNGRIHDRPQIVADFLSDQSTRCVETVFMLMTRKRASALPTDRIARAFCQETWWFLDGPTMC